MSPSIFDMFGDDALEGEGSDAPFDPAKLDSALDQAIADRPVAGRPPGFDPTATPSSAPSSDGEASGAEGGAPGTPTPVVPEAPVSPPPLPQSGGGQPRDPFADLTDMERLELAQLRQALADPERALGVRRAMLGVEAAPAPGLPGVPAPVAGPPEPTLPEDIDPHSFEAQLWQQNQEMRRELQGIRETQQQTQQVTEEQIINQAARTSTTNFAARYAGRLTKEEIQAVAQQAGIQKLPDAFRPVSGSWEEAMDKALEFTVRSNDALLGKVLGVAAPPPAAPPAAPTPSESDTRKRQLHALSSAASPSGEATTRVPLEHRGDGKLTEKSRLALVQELVNGDGSLRGPLTEG